MCGRKQVKETVKEAKKEDKRTQNRFSAIMETGDDAEEEELEESDIEEEEEVEEVEDIDLDELSGQMAMDPEDIKSFAKFMGGSKNTEPSKTLNDIILDKLMEHERKKAEGAIGEKKMTAEEAYAQVRSNLSPKVVQAYSLIGKLLKHYTAGRLPKAFNIIPALSNWEEIVYLTRPEEWSPQAVRAATRVFASNMNRGLATRFYSLILFPRVRDDIDRHKKLNWHIYMALKKSLWKADAFYKGIILPLCESGDATLREAVILASLIRRVSIPAAHSAVALYKIAQLPFSPANTFFLGVLLNKKYALPYEVLDGVVEHFLRARDEQSTPPVLWHQALLVLAQRYKNELTAEQKEGLKSLTRLHQHYLITPEIKRELLASRNREDDPSVPVPDMDSAPRRHRKPKPSMKPSFALPGQVPAEEDGEDDGEDDDDDNAMEE